MGLEIVVGVLSIVQDDPEALDFTVRQLDALNRALLARGLPAFSERCLRPDLIWRRRVGDMALRHLRRVAAHLWKTGRLPHPDLDDRQAAGVVRWYEAKARRGETARGGFDHLVLHSETSGFYLPVDFDPPLAPDPTLLDVGGRIGSSQRLLGECARLANVLHLPLEGDPETEEVTDVVQAASPVAGKPTMSHVDAARACFILHQAARRSIDLHAAVLFE